MPAPSVFKVCFVSSRSGYFKSNTEVITDWANGRLITELFKCTEFQFSLALFDDPTKGRNYDHNIIASSIDRLPFPMNYYSGLRNSWSIFRILKEIERKNDILIIQLPIVSFLPLLFLRKPVLYHVCANVLTASNNRFKYRGMSLLASRSFAWFMHKIHCYLFSKSSNKVIVNGAELGLLYRKFDPRVCVSSSIYSNEVVDIKSAVRRASEEFRILFIGRPSKEKGIHLLLEAFSNLLAEGKDVSLWMIGVERRELENGLSDLPLSDMTMQRIHFFGFVSWGEKFREIVTQCHCLVMSSVSEGTPRVLIEARSLGCPVIATKVGGVSSSVTDGIDGILIEANGSDQIQGALLRLMNDETLRMKLATNGIETIKKYSLEKFVSTFEIELRKLRR